jgi:hypothetical protein
MVTKATERAHLSLERESSLLTGHLLCLNKPFRTALAMIGCSLDSAWEHNQFRDVIVRATNVEM